MILLLSAALASVAVGSLLAWSSWHLGLGGALFPASRDNSSGANFMGIIGVVALLITVGLLAFRSPSDLQLTPSGVTRHVRRHRGFKVTDVNNFAAWTDITAITPETQVVSSGPSDIHNQLIRVTFRGADASQTDATVEQDFLIQAHLLVAEPNTLYSLMKHMQEHPEDRNLLAREDAAGLLTPPPLRDRFRAAREAKKAEKAKRRSNA
ncbi:MAG: hypothetical protein GX610_20110 [Rhodococcus sp.]|nr:hypothetical protein [Rhodococcus sp. (in: high G+C Gram-positive bacteria)]